MHRMRSAIVILSVCPSVRPGVTSRYRIKPRWDRDFGFSPYDCVVSSLLRPNFVPLGEEIPLKRGHQKGYRLRNRQKSGKRQRFVIQRLWNQPSGKPTFMSDAMESGMCRRLRLRQSAVLSPNIVATEQSVGVALPASDDRCSTSSKHVVHICNTNDLWYHDTARPIGQHSLTANRCTNNIKH